jgi:hypothetical protein
MNKESNPNSKRIALLHERINHIDLHHHCIMEQVHNKDIESIYHTSQDQLIDIFSKALNKDKIQKVPVDAWCERIQNGH